MPSGKNSHPFPPAPAGQKRYMIYLEEQPNEDELKVLLIPGRMEMVDGVNNYVIKGKIKLEFVENKYVGYYNVTMGRTLRTIMLAYGEDGKKRERFVPMNRDKVIRYNSKIPIVVYVPEGAIVKYKILGVVKGSADGMYAQEE